MNPSRSLVQVINRSAHELAQQFEQRLRADLLERVSLALADGEAETEILAKVGAYARERARAGIRENA